MYVKINRDVCGHHISKCERCLGKFLQEPLGYERQCFEVIEDNGSDILTMDIKSGSNEFHLELNERLRKILGGEGWAKILEEADVL